MTTRAERRARTDAKVRERERLIAQVAPLRVPLHTGKLRNGNTVFGCPDGRACPFCRHPAKRSSRIEVEDIEA